MINAVSLTRDLAANLQILRGRLFAPQNADVIIRRFRSGAFSCALLAIDGMVNTQLIDENILKPCMNLPESAGENVPGEERIAFLMAHAVSILPIRMKENIDEILSDVLGGQCALLCEECAVACVMDTRGFEKRSVGKPETERVVLGPHESFGESIRTNITLIRRIVQRETLITEFITVGGGMKTRCALLYLRGTADEAQIARIRGRLQRIDYDFALTTGEIEQFIEDHPLSLIPQCVRTERPDRAASFLAEGQILVLTDGSPAVLGAPATLLHQLHTPDDSAMRWQYGTFLRIVRMCGVAIHVLLPGLYLAVLRFHQELLSPLLLTSVYETSSRVPVPLFLEALLMTLAFDLINEAGLRAPGSLGNALGIVSGLILGQSAVSADIVSPLLLIVIAASGLGGFCVPGYALSIGLKIVQLMVLAAGAAGGLYLILMLMTALLCALFAMQSFSSPLAAPIAPPRRHNPDLFVRLPLCFQTARSFFSRPKSPKTTAARIRDAYRVRACACGVSVGAMVFALGAGAATPLCLNAAYLAACFSLPACALIVCLCCRALRAPAKAARIRPALIGATLAMVSVFSLCALISLARQALLPLSRVAFVAAVSIAFWALCCLSAPQGAARTAFAFRLFLPAALLLLSIVPLTRNAVSGLFPLLGTGAKPVFAAGLCMCAAAAPALMLSMPPPTLRDIPEPEHLAAIPKTGFFLRRVLLGAIMGVLLLCVLSLCSPYTTLADRRTWGERMLLLSIDAPREGVAHTLLTLLEAFSLLLCAVNSLLAAAQAFGLAAKALHGRLGTALCLLIVSAAVAALLFAGFDQIILPAAFLSVPAVIAALLCARKR